MAVAEIPINGSALPAIFFMPLNQGVMSEFGRMQAMWMMAVSELGIASPTTGLTAKLFARAILQRCSA